MNSTATKKLVNPFLPTIGMPGFAPVIRFLARVQKAIPGSLNSLPAVSVLRYGNRAQAEAKRASLADRISQEGSASAVVQVESRFLIAIFPAEYDLDQKTGTLVRKVQKTETVVEFERTRTGIPIPSRPIPFATVSGPRINPRNRHNQNGAGPVYYQQGPTTPIASRSRRFDPTQDEWAKPIRIAHRREQYRAVYVRLNERGQ